MKARKLSEEQYIGYLNEVFDFKARFGYGKKKGLLTSEEKLKRLDVCRYYLNILSPEWESLKVFHVAGSCGKGTTAFFLSNILATCYRVGTLLSPHIFDVTERILLDLKEITRKELMSFWEAMLRPAIEEKADEEAFVLSLPEIMFVTAVHYFLHHEVDYVVLETGLGGRYDQTNIVTPLASFITTIAPDHTHILGTTITKIAQEKGGIIKPHIPFYTTETNEEVLKVFKETCKQQHAPFHHVSPEHIPFPLKLPEDIDTDHNRMNASLAARGAMDILCFSENRITMGLARTRLKGRFEHRRNTIVDIAHNEAETRALVSALERKYPHKKKIVALGMADKKRHKQMLEPFAEMARAGTLEAIFFGRAGYRGVPPELLMEITQGIEGLQGTEMEVFESPVEAYVTALKRTEGDEEKLVVVTGSTFFVDAVFNPSPSIKEVNMRNKKG